MNLILFSINKSDTNIPLYDLSNEDGEKWNKYNLLISEKNWFMENRNCNISLGK